jgi:hypothetical protein
LEVSLRLEPIAEFLKQYQEGFACLASILDDARGNVDA